jgi:FtsH-binding integral membrane protein
MNLVKYFMNILFAVVMVVGLFLLCNYFFYQPDFPYWINLVGHILLTTFIIFGLNIIFSEE